MTDTINRVEIIKMQAELEIAIMELYEVFAKEFSYCDLWKKLVEEEKKHSSWLKGLAGKVKDGSANYDKCVFVYEKIKKAVENLRKFTEGIKTRPIAISEAFDYAINLESSIYEKEYLSSFETDSDILKQTIETLIKESKMHKEMIEAENLKFSMSCY